MQDLNYDRIYSYRFKDYPIEVRRNSWHIISNWIFKHFGSPERVLDPAAGTLEFIASVPANEAWAVDKFQTPPSAMPKNLRHVQADIFEADLPGDYFDLVFTSNFLEHLNSPEELQALLKRMYGLLRRGGRMVVMGPNFKYCTTEYFDCADHRLPLSHLAIEEFLYAAGFEVAESHPRFLPYSFRSRVPKAGWLIKLYLAVPLFWRIFGKQYLVSGVKK